MWKVGIVLIFSFILCGPFLWPYFYTYRVADHSLGQSVSTIDCKINWKEISFVPCEDGVTSSSCDKNFCLLHGSFIPEGNIYPSYFTRYGPEYFCTDPDVYPVDSSLDCRYNPKARELYFTENIECIKDTCFLVLICLVFVIFPLLFISLSVVSYCLSCCCYKSEIYRVDERDIPMTEFSDKSEINDFLQAGSPLRETFERHYNSSRSVEEVIDVYRWKRTPWFSIRGCFLLVFTFIAFVLWVSICSLNYYEVNESLTCREREWETHYFPVVKSICLFSASVSLFLAGVIGIFLSFYWYYRRFRYLIALPDEILYTKETFLLGKGKVITSLPFVSSSNLKNSWNFSSTCKILFLCSWHPIFSISEENSNSGISFPVFHKDVANIRNWLHNVYHE